jgi:hypothetical protein
VGDFAVLAERFAVIRREGDQRPAGLLAERRDQPPGLAIRLLDLPVVARGQRPAIARRRAAITKESDLVSCAIVQGTKEVRTSARSRSDLARGRSRKKQDLTPHQRNADIGSTRSARRAGT